MTGRRGRKVAAGVVAVVFTAGISVGILHLSAARTGLVAQARNLRSTTVLASGGRSGQAEHAGDAQGV